MLRTLALALVVAAAQLSAQMTVDQKLSDFQNLVALYSKQYAPYEWTRDAVKFDLLQIGPWAERIRKSKDDFEFLDLCAEYVTSLQDAHSQFFLPSPFAADSGLFLDFYDGKVLVDAIDRGILPLSSFPVEVGDELLAVDGRSPEEWLTELTKFVSSGNPRARQRDALDLIVYRPQAQYPRAHLTPDRSRFLFKRQNGLTEGYDIRWLKFGTPITAIGPVPGPFLTPTENSGAEYPLATPAFRGLPELRRAHVQRMRAVRGIEAVTPLFNLPAGFVRRLGTTRDFVYSGTYQSSGVRIGYLRVPSMHDPSNPFAASAALNQIVTEVAFMERNTDGLIVDLMRNPGGDVCFAQDLMSLMTQQNFTIAGAEIRATREWIARYESLIAQLEDVGFDKWVTDLLTAFLKDIRGAYSENRGRTGPLPVCDLTLEIGPARDRLGALLGTSKPIMLLVDDFTASAAELFAAAIQDNGRGIVFGMPTQGAGGTISNLMPTGWYSETSASVAQSLFVRSKSITTDEYPSAPYFQNIGIRPDVKGDIMTVDDLQNNGRQFVQAFTAAFVDYVRK